MTAIDFLRAHQRFTRKLPKDLNFDEYKHGYFEHGKHTRIWVAPHKDQWVYKANYSLNGLGVLGYSSGHIHSTMTGAVEDAIAVSNEIEAYIDALTDRLNCPLELAPVFTPTGYFIENEETDRRVIAWYRLNMGILGNDENTRLYNVSIERTRHYTIRINALWIFLEIGFNSLTLKRDAYPSHALYYIYGMCYGLLGDQFASLADDIPF